MAAASTRGTPGGSGDGAPGAASPPVQPSARLESILPASPNDQATLEDTLGFTPYAEALASFLTHPATKAPLTLSIEGKWGSGKSSFIRQLEGHIKEAEKRRKTNPPSLMVRFNPWRHDKEEALWAAFALDFLRQVREQRRFAPRWLCDIRLFLSRFSWKSGWMELVRKVALWLCFLSVPVAVILLAVFRGNDYIGSIVELLTRQPLTKAAGSPLPAILDRVLRADGVAGCAALVAYLLTRMERLVGNPLEVRLQKHLKVPQYEGSVSFIERFHRDFPKIVNAYAGKRRVYVFVDDLDRCQVPRAADLMQAINLMISADQQLVFVIGMDWETVAAGIAVKNSELVRYLKRSAARKEADGALEFGREFLEKFVQLRFALPRPGEDDLKRLLQALSRPPAPPRNPGYWQRLLGLPASLKSTFTRLRDPRPEVSENGGPREAAAVPSARFQESIEFGIDGDSDTIRDVTLALAPAFGNNPRRVKQFLSLFRLRTFIAKQTGLFASSRHQSNAKAMTLEQLGKFTALEILWPSLLQEAERNRGLLRQLEEGAAESGPAGWLSVPGVRDLFRLGCQEKESSARDASGTGKWSFANLDVDRLLRVSPYVGAFDEKIAPVGSETPGGDASTGADGWPAGSFLLQVSRVPFRDGQNADFIRKEISGESKGFKLKIAVPQEAYWRCGFVLAPEDYIREGRLDVTITQYFLFHIGQGDPRDPKQRTGLHFQVYRQDRSDGPMPFRSESPVDVDVRFGQDGDHVAIEFGDKHLEMELTPSYLRYLYILAWADRFPPFRVPVELTLR